ncbi:DUF3858 domain-containing protein [Bacteroides sp.]|uniref:DUF3858 domain-containing protein n=1 Tax=Bacteroides sp. TaxID=29523 RepID=UPI002626F0A1|nr:DUF3858 domain-containing protein [Bacteroides sp.]MDD3038371.1 DUF3858 domain-containing protein [Bacteroides sp.]
MKLTLILSFLLFCWQSLAADVITPSAKFGNPSKEELMMTVYEPDSAASAVVLHSKTNVEYEFTGRRLRVVYKYHVKIKVLKPSGTSYADITIPYFAPESNSSIPTDIVSHIDAFSYNLDGKETVSTKMKNDMIFRERLNKQFMQAKFSIPAVKEGTLFEYKYELSSDYFYTINPWIAQQDIPVLFTQYDITIPDVLKFSTDMRGGERLETKREDVNLSFSFGGENVVENSNGHYFQFIGRQLPAVRPDNNVWCTDDYLTGVSFELKGLELPGEPYKSFTQAWDNIDKMLLEDDDFGKLLKTRNPYQEEIKTLGLDQLPDIHNKVAAIYTFLKNKISWNGQYKLYGNDVKKAIKDGTGSNADINFVLMSMLQEANIPCFPVVMSRRDTGVLPYIHPTIKKLNTFVVGIANTDTTLVYLDGSVQHGFINVLPPVLMVKRARLINPNGPCSWIDLSEIGKNQIRSMVNVQINTDGKIAGTRVTTYKGQFASSFRKRYQEAKDSTEFINKLEANESIKISELQTKKVTTFAPDITEFIKFEKQAAVNGNLIYINPLIFLHISKCPFTQVERQLPLEMPYPEELNFRISLQIPEGYTVEELPESIQIQTSDGKCVCLYKIGSTNGKIEVAYVFKSDKLLHLPAEYQEVKSFWEHVAEKNNQMLVLKKI